MGLLQIRVTFWKLIKSITVPTMGLYYNVSLDSRIFKYPHISTVVLIRESSGRLLGKKSDLEKNWNQKTWFCYWVFYWFAGYVIFYLFGLQSGCGDSWEQLWCRQDDTVTRISWVAKSPLYGNKQDSDFYQPKETFFFFSKPDFFFSPKVTEIGNKWEEMAPR